MYVALAALLQVIGLSIMSHKCLRHDDRPRLQVILGYPIYAFALTVRTRYFCSRCLFTMLTHDGLFSWLLDIPFLRHILCFIHALA